MFDSAVRRFMATPVDHDDTVNYGLGFPDNYHKIGP
jgi:hypothetical protein